MSLEKLISLKNFPLKEVFGLSNENLKILKENFSGKIYIRGDELSFVGDDKEFEILKKVLNLLQGMVKEGNF